MLSAWGFSSRPPRRGTLVAALSVAETVSWGVLYYAFGAFLVPMGRDLDATPAQLTGAFSVGLVVSSVAGIAVGRHLDRHGPRALMTAGALAGAGLVVAWSRVESVAALYAVWACIGLVLAAVLYEPAFVVLAKSVPGASDRRRAMTALTMVAGLASFIFLPLSQVLIDAYGWRDALVVLAVVLAASTAPLHALVVGRADPSRVTAAETEAPPRGATTRSARFRLLAASFFLASLAATAVIVLGIPLLLSRGYDASFAAAAIGLAGAAQIPGRGVFGAVAARLPRAVAMGGVFALIALGTAVLAALDATGTVLVGTVLLGMGNGMATLARATVMADHFGIEAYGTVAGVAAAWSTAARAVGPSAAALVVAAYGYSAMLWMLCMLAVAAGLMACAAELRGSGRVAGCSIT